MAEITGTEGLFSAGRQSFAPISTGLVSPVNPAPGAFGAPAITGAFDISRKPVTAVNTTAEYYKESQQQEPLSALEQSFFDFEQIQYPAAGLGSRYPHYMTFYFNVASTASRFNKAYKGVNLDESLSTTGKKSFSVSAGLAGLSTREINRRGTGSAQPISSDVKGQYASIDLSRETVRTSHSIRLYMPDTLQWNFAQQWRDPHLSDSGRVQALAPGVQIAEGVATGTGSGVLAGVITAIKTAGSKILEVATGLPDGLVLSKLGHAVNPMIEVLYTSPDLRTFTLEFNFAPRSYQEGVDVQRIIRAFKFFAAPEVPDQGGLGFLMIPPGDIDIEFSISTLGKISTCVLKNIDLDYAPNGFVAYQEPGNIREGMPVNIRMRLEFTETEYITKDLVLKGY
jgi:hypothetical protein